MYCPNCKRQVSGSQCPACGYKDPFSRAKDLGDPFEKRPPDMPKNGFIGPGMVTGAAPRGGAAAPAVPEVGSHSAKAAGGFKKADSLSGGHVSRTPEPTPPVTKPAPPVIKPAEPVKPPVPPEFPAPPKPAAPVKPFRWLPWLPVTIGAVGTVCAVVLVALLAGGAKNKDTQRTDKAPSHEKPVIQEYIAPEEKVEKVTQPEVPQPTTHPPETTPAKTWPTQAELFDDTYWIWVTGMTVGTQKPIWMHKDGTFEHVDGWFGTYSYSDGVLELSGDLYDLQENGNFVSREVFWRENGQQYMNLKLMSDSGFRTAEEAWYDWRGQNKETAQPTSAPTTAPTSAPVDEEFMTPPSPPQQMFGTWYFYTTEGGEDTVWCICFDENETFRAFCGIPASEEFYDYFEGTWWYVYEVEKYTFSLNTGGEYYTVRLDFKNGKMYLRPETENCHAFPAYFDVGYEKDLDYYTWKFGG